GLLLLALAGLALLFPLLASLWVTAAVALALVVAGLAGWIGVLLRVPRLHRALLLGRLLVASLLVVAGLALALPLLAQPAAGRAPAAALALVLGAVFLVEGLVALATALRHRGERGWGWGLGNAGVTLALGTLLLVLPRAALAAGLGLLVGISLLFSGLDLLLFAARLPGATADDAGDGEDGDVGG
ncbi:MAG: DUF308 domain-containing protein, partial [Synechococcaceae cyanobacterium]|nr:DUF308 domain-containing protein [Synechococcaceae cyanobacterium]